MNRVLKIAAIFPLATVVVGVGVGRLTGAGSVALGCSRELATGFAGTASDVAEGHEAAAVAGNKIVTVDGGTREAYVPAGAGEGLLRHVASAPERGTAYVTDRKGSDTIVVVRPEGLLQIAGSGEVTHPAWSQAGALVWAVDFKALKMLEPQKGGSARTIAAPDGSRAIFSPVFTGPQELTAIVEEPVSGDTEESDSLNNLWRYDLDTEKWTRITRFGATAERWSVLRTPLATEDATVFFVRIQGVASETRPPKFELWSIREGAASKIRDLPREMFLAGVNDQGLVWNVYDGLEWRLYQETNTGLVDMGCGAVMVDPRGQPDPDIQLEEASLAQPGRFQQGTNAEDSLGDAQLGILLGDYGSRQEAERIARSLGLTGLHVVDHGQAPLAVAPGKWGLAKRLPPAADPTRALDEFRQLFPGFQDRSWIVSLGGRRSIG